MSLDRLVGDSKVIAVICNQWGDTGKGKFSDYFAANWADVVARGTGGNNAGHTVSINGVERVFHLIPSGITQDGNGVVNIIGQGTVIDLPTLVKEMDEVLANGGSYDNLMISSDAHLIMPYNIIRDQNKNKSQKNGGIGSTGRGIGPCYADKTRRFGIKVSDMLLPRAELEKKLARSVKSYNSKKDPAELASFLYSFLDRVGPHIKDTFNEIHRLKEKGNRILLEGAQGLLLSIEHGTYPYVTSSDCSINGTAGGVGISAKDVDRCFGIVKYPFMTRVGGGPFPTELGGEQSESYCGEEHIKMDELNRFGIPHFDGKYDSQHPKILELMNSEDPFLQGIGIRLAAGEYGATTGRPRRTGWTDAVAAKYAVRINGPLLILTKADAISGIDEFKIATSYSGSTDFPRDKESLRDASPKYKTYKGYSDIREVRNYSELPSSLRTSITDFEKFTKGNVAAVSVGPDRDETIIL